MEEPDRNLKGLLRGVLLEVGPIFLQ